MENKKTLPLLNNVEPETCFDNQIVSFFIRQ